LTFKEIGEELGISKTTAYNRMQLWKNEKGSMPAKKKEVEEVKDLVNLMASDDVVEAAEGVVGATLASKETARKTGQITGADIVTLKNTFAKLLDGSVDWQSVSSIAANLQGIRDGLEAGDSVSREILQAISKRREEDVIDIEDKEKEEEVE